MAQTAQEVLELMQTYRAVFGTPSGQQILEDMQGFCGFKSSCFVPGQPDDTAFRLGRRSVYLYILDKLDAEKLEAVRKLTLQSQRQEE